MVYGSLGISSLGCFYKVLGSGQGILGVICGLEGVLDHAWWFLIIAREFPVRCTSELRLSITNLLVVACDAILFGRDITQLVPECSALPTKSQELHRFIVIYLHLCCVSYDPNPFDLRS